MIVTHSRRPTENPTTTTTTHQPRLADVMRKLIVTHSRRPTENPTTTKTTHQPRLADVPEEVDSHPQQKADRDLVQSEVVDPVAHKEDAGVEEDYRVGHVDQNTD